MTVASSTNRNGYSGNGSTEIYNYGFKIFNEDDLTVIVTNTSTSTETTLTKTTDYTVTGVGDTSGGSVTLVNASQSWLDGSGYLDTGFDLTIRRVVGITQETDIRNQGDFYPEAHEDQMDKSIMIDQQQQDDLDRAIKLPESLTSSDFDPTMPYDIAGSTSLGLVTNAAGNGFEMGPTVNEIGNAQTYATNASTSADEAAASAAAALVSENAAAADLVLTNADVISTAADAVQTNADKIASAASAAAALISENNAETAETNAETAQTAAELAETNAETAQVAAELAYTNTVALLATSVSNKEIINNSATNTDLSVAIDETTHTDMIFEYVVVRGSSRQYGKLLISDNSPFDISELEKAGDVGVTFDISESSGIGTLNYSSTNDTTGVVRYKYYSFEIGA